MRNVTMPSLTTLALFPSEPNKKTYTCILALA